MAGPQTPLLESRAVVAFVAAAIRVAGYGLRCPRHRKSRPRLPTTNDPPQALCQLCHGYELVFAGLGFNDGGDDGHGRCVQWTHLNPFPQVVDGAFEVLSDPANLFNQVKRLK